jgi:hypothetical protein
MCGVPLLPQMGRSLETDVKWLRTWIQSPAISSKMTISNSQKGKSLSEEHKKKIKKSPIKPKKISAFLKLANLYQKNTKKKYAKQSLRRI